MSDGGRTQLEAGVCAAARAGLIQRGHSLSSGANGGGYQSITYDAEANSYIGATVRSFASSSRFFWPTFCHPCCFGSRSAESDARRCARMGSPQAGDRSDDWLGDRSTVGLDDEIQMGPSAVCCMGSEWRAMYRHIFGARIPLPGTHGQRGSAGNQPARPTATPPHHRGKKESRRLRLGAVP